MFENPREDLPHHVLFFRGEQIDQMLANPGAYTLTVSYAGNTQHLAVGESTIFTVPSDGIDRIFADGFDGD